VEEFKVKLPGEKEGGLLYPGGETAVAPTVND